MSLVIFFGFTAIFLIFSTVYVAVSIRHHYKLSKLGKHFHDDTRKAQNENHPS